MNLNMFELFKANYIYTIINMNYTNKLFMPSNLA